MSRACSSVKPRPIAVFGELLDEEEHVGGAGAGDRAERVDLRPPAPRAPSPTVSNSARTSAMSLVASRAMPAASPVTPRPTTDGVFGIERTHRRCGTSASIVAMVTPAATLTTMASGVERVARSRASRSGTIAASPRSARCARRDRGAVAHPESVSSASDVDARRERSAAAFASVRLVTRMPPLDVDRRATAARRGSRRPSSRRRGWRCGGKIVVTVDQS